MALAAALLLGACGGGEDKQDALTTDEDRQLNDAAAMLDEPEVKSELQGPGPDARQNASSKN